MAVKGVRKGGDFRVNPPLELDILQKLYHKGSVYGLIFTKIRGVHVEEYAYYVNKLRLKT